MAPRVQVVLSEADRQRFQVQAERDGESLSTWMRTAAWQRIERVGEAARLDSVAALDSFFAACDEREAAGTTPEPATEPDWETHARVIAESRAQSLPEP